MGYYFVLEWDLACISESMLQGKLDALASRKAPADAAKTDASNALFMFVPVVMPNVGGTTAFVVPRLRCSRGRSVRP